MKFEEIRKSLVHLTKAELKQLISHATVLMTRATDDKEAPDEFVQVILLYAKKHVGVPHIIINGLEKNLLIAASELRDLCRELGLDRKESHKLCDKLIKAATLSLAELPNMEVSFTTLINIKLTNPKSLLDWAYPGYSADNLKRFVLNGKTSSIYTRKCDRAAVL